MKIQKIEQTKGFEWIEDEMVYYECECGNKLVVDIYGNPNYGNPKIDRWKKNISTCETCGRKYFLKQENTIYEVIE